ncbi:MULTISPECIES: winged helix-turn-helix transcriptional regulator [unclassified Agarivorans]|uniref:winged helix-turn-helix transcriptional regulator n=1 Tax=unclassified Agarivorans TaxID=2636026 RepID=UPI003D7EEE9D
MKRVDEEYGQQPKVGFSERFTRGDVFSAQCPSREVLKHITNRWGGLVLIALKLNQGPAYRFSELRRLIQGVSEKMLAQTLKMLEQDGFVQRTDFQVVPPHVEYSLTPLGAEVAVHVVGLADWLEEHIQDILSHRKLS